MDAQTSLFPDESQIWYDRAFAMQIMGRLPENAHLGDIADLLKERDARYSGTWPEMFEKRVEPALKAGKITVDDLLNLLRDTEEHNQQHVFMYRCENSYSKSLLSEESLARRLQRAGLATIYKQPLLLKIPDQSTIVDARFDTLIKPSDCFVLKIVERRVREKQTKVDENDDIVIRHYQKIHSRAVTVVRLHRTGFLEVRIQSHDTNSPTRYASDLKNVWQLIETIIDHREFDEHPLHRARESFLADRETLAEKLTIVSTGAKDLAGNEIKLRSPPTGSLLRAENALLSIDVFRKPKGAYCDELNIEWLRQEQGFPTRNVRILLSGQPYQFILTKACRKVDYDFVVRDLTRRSR
jgi:hypothetical protein